MNKVLSSTSKSISLLLTSRVRATLRILSALPAATLSILAIVLGPGIAGAYPADIVFWSLLAVLQIAIFIVAGTINYRLIIRKNNAEPRKRWRIYRFAKYSIRFTNFQRIVIVWMESIIASIILVHIGLHITNPYAKVSVVQQPYMTNVKDGSIFVTKQFDLHVASGPLAESLGYYKSGFLILQNALFGSYPARSADATGIINDIHTLRFDPSKPYLISGDQFSVLYPRNLGVFYNSLLDYRTAHSQQDWQNRQRIYLQSALYALDAFSSAKQLTTTIVPISPRSVALTEVHPGSVPSDSLYGILYAFDQLEHAKNVETGDATKEIIATRKNDLSTLLTVYLQTVQDPSTGLVKRGIHLAAARDGILRDGSFYDNIVLWKTLQLADQLGIHESGEQKLSALHAKIMKTFWLDNEGYFKDDQKTTDYSSDWLIAIPTSFLSKTDTDDMAKVARIVAYTKRQKLDQPFPIRYSKTNGNDNVPFAVKKFVPNYGGDAIWSYWGSEYIYVLALLYNQTGDQAYKSDADHFVSIYKQKIVDTHGFPETFDTDGNFLQNPVYKSIRQTGWVVQFEQAEAELNIAKSQ